MGFWSPSLPAVLDEGGNVVPGAQQIDFVGAGVNVTSAVEGKATVTIPGGSGNTLVTEETPAGLINDVNTVFTLAHAPVAGTLKVYLGGQRQQSGGGDYTLAGSTITFNIAPMTGSILIADYEY